WVVFYGMLGVLSSIVYYRNNEFPFPSARSTALIVMISGLVYYTAYLVQGVIEEAILGQWGRYLTQDYVWSGSAYAVFPTLVATPAALYLMNDGARWVRTLAWGAIAQMMVVAWYYDSRVSWLVLFGMFTIAWRQIRPLRVAAIVGIFLLIAIPFVEDFTRDVP